MSESVTCDVCGKTGRRRMKQVVPEGWLFGESKIDGESALQPNGNITAETMVCMVCSEDCSKRFWRKGPGRINLMSGELFPSIDGDT